MLEQQLQVNQPELDKQSRIDWTRVQKLYHHTAKVVHPPEPDYFGTAHLDGSKCSLSQFQLLLSQILREVQQQNTKQLSTLQLKFNQQIKDLQQRVFKLQHLLFLQNKAKNAQPSVQIKNKGYHTPVSKSQNNFKEIETTELPARQTKSFIYIEQNEQNDISLLDQNQQQENTPRKNQRNKKNSRFSKPFTPLKVEVEEGQQEIEDSINKQRIFNANCSFHQKELTSIKNQLNVLKTNMEQIHKIEISEQPWINKTNNIIQSLFPQPNPELLFRNSPNSEQHLINQNNALRQLLKRYKQYLKRIKHETGDIKNLLYQAIDSNEPNQPIK